MKRKLTALKHARRAGLLSAVLAAGFAALAAPTSLRAQAPPPPPPAPGDYAQPTASNVEGTVAQYLINPRGEVDGLLLGDNTIVRFPPHLSAQLIAAIKPQAAVKVDGFSAVAGTIRATSITDKGTGRSITDTPPAAGAPPPPPPPLDAAAQQQMSASGTIKALTRAPRGEVDGAILSDGTIVHFGPANGTQLASLLVVGQPLAATGNGVTNQYGKSLEANALGASADKLQPIAARPEPRGPKPRGPKDAGAPPPPPPGAPVPPPQA